MAASGDVRANLVLLVLLSLSCLLPYVMASLVVWGFSD